MAGIDGLAILLGTAPGSLVYHLIVLLALEAALGISITEYRHTRNPDQRRMAWAFALAAVLRGALLLASVWEDPLAGPVRSALELLGLAFIGWAFVAAVIGRRAAGLFLGVNLIAAGLALALLLPSWLRTATQDSSVAYSAHWQQAAWDAWTAAAAAAVAAIALARPGRIRHVLQATAFAFLAAGAVLSAVDALGWARGVNLVGYPLLAVSVYRMALQDLWDYRSELEALSEGALRQTRELLFLLDVGRALGDSFQLQAVLDRVAESLAHALDADRVAVLLWEREADSLWVAAQYVPLQRQIGEGEVRLAVSEQPLVMHVIRRRKPLLVNPQARSSSLRALYEVLGAESEGPAILQPLLREHRVLGVLVVGNDRSGRPFGMKEARLCDAVAPQIAAAVENARLYHQLGRQAEELVEALEVKERESRWLESVLESIAEGIIVADGHGRAVRANRAAAEILGVDRERILGRPLPEILESISGQLIRWQELCESGKPARLLITVEGKRVQVHGTVVRSPRGDALGTVAVLRDVTGEVQAERAKRDFIASVSHELRTPLTAILGYAEVLYSQTVGRLSDTQVHILQIIHSNARRMITIANNLIALAEAERGRMELQYADTDLALILGEVVESFVPRMRARQLNWRLRIEADLPVIEADPDRIRQVVSNLVSNAVKYTFPGGEVEVGADLLPVPESDGPRFCRIWVRDTGIGIRPEEQGKIWQRFYRPEDPLRAQAGGLGVGLSVVKSVTEAHGGRVWVESEPGRGSTFTVLLPIRRPAPSLLEGEPTYPELNEAAMGPAEDGGPRGGT